MDEMMSKFVVVLSGGLDSTTLLYKVKKETRDVYAISFNYGQRHSKELEMAAETCKKLKIPHEIVDLTSITKLISNSSLTSDQDVPEGHYQDENMKQTVVPNRNMIMASIAIGYAVNIGADTVALGVHAGDHQVYPDCRPEFIRALQAVAQVANYDPINIWTPYLHISKSDIVAEGIDLGVDYGLTWTCYKGEKEACGKCGSCVERLEAFADNYQIDPLKYNN